MRHTGDLEDRVNNNEMIYPNDFVLYLCMNQVYRIVSYQPIERVMFLETEKYTGGHNVAAVTNRFAYLGSGSFEEFNRLVSL